MPGHRALARQGYTNAESPFTYLHRTRFVAGDPSNDNVPDESEKVNRTNKMEGMAVIFRASWTIGILLTWAFTAIWPTPLFKQSAYLFLMAVRVGP